MLYFSGIPYQLDQLATESYNQPKLSAFFTPKNTGACEIENLHTDNLSNQPLSSSSEDYAYLDQADGCNVEQGDLMQVESNRVISEDQSCCVKSSSEVKDVDMSDFSPLDGKKSDLKHISSKCQASVSLCSNSPDNHIFNEASTSRIGVLPNQHHSTLSDPNFVENYFKVILLIISTPMTFKKLDYPSSFF